MRTLVLGGIRSGKSRWAEQAIAESCGDAPVRYLATGPVADDESWSARVAAHQLRRPPHWETVETSDVVAHLHAHPGTAALVDDIGNWLTTAMDRAGAWSGGPVTADTDALVAAVEEFGSPLMLVSPEVGLTVVPDSEAGRRFADALGTLNQRLAAVCDRVVLVIAGQPLTLTPQRP
ncbi:adenosylcobinamide kinase/adenosylcobinamide phosphate guanyltransferase [Mycobacterium sp. djl-10]|nr:adenosylcobinamide kinase/adenosylcobinamide phosphate guanyltransferase [Mycobacterium sp. djl-10]